MTLEQVCHKYFHTTNLYKVLNIDKTASEKDVKKAYYNLSLKVHPDRVSTEDKEIATEKFKVLGKIHQILTDPHKRNAYNNDGFIDESGDETTMNWSHYWTIIKKEITLKDIQNYEKNYKGSDEELEDFKRSYMNYKGDMDRILDGVPFSSCDDEPRFMELAKKCIESGEIIHYKTFFNEPTAKYIKRHNKHKERMARAAKEEMLKEKESALVPLQKREIHKNVKRAVDSSAEEMSISKANTYGKRKSKYAGNSNAKP